MCVDEYGCTLVFPPPEAFSHPDVIAIRNPSPQAYSVRFRFYIEEEGLSDLELQATLIEDPTGDLMTVELDGILVA